MNCVALHSRNLPILRGGHTNFVTRNWPQVHETITEAIRLVFFVIVYDLAVQSNVAYKLKRISPLRHGNLVVRPKKNGSGLHWGRFVDLDSLGSLPTIQPGYRCKLGIVETNLETGQQITTIPEFPAGMGIGIIETNYSEAERRALDQLAFLNLGSPYSALENCEDVALGFSPTRNKVLALLAVAGSALLVWKSSSQRK